MDENLRLLLNTGEAIIASLGDLTFTCLRNLEALSREDVDRFLRQRQKGVAELATFDAEFRAMEKAMDQDDGDCFLLLTDFSRRFRETLGKIVEADALIRALATSRQVAIRSKLGAVVQGHRAMQGYGGGGRRRAAMGLIA